MLEGPGDIRVTAGPGDKEQDAGALGQGQAGKEQGGEGRAPASLQRDREGTRAAPCGEGGKEGPDVQAVPPAWLRLEIAGQAFQSSPKEREREPRPGERVSWTARRDPGGEWASGVGALLGPNLRHSDQARVGLSSRLCLTTLWCLHPIPAPARLEASPSLGPDWPPVLPREGPSLAEDISGFPGQLWHLPSRLPCFQRGSARRPKDVLVLLTQTSCRGSSESWPGPGSQPTWRQAVRGRGAPS